MGTRHFRATGDAPTFPLGRSVAVRIRRDGNSVEAFADGRLLVRVRDRERPYREGAVGIYAEDAHAVFEVRRLQP